MTHRLSHSSKTRRPESALGSLEPQILPSALRISFKSIEDEEKEDYEDLYAKDVGESFEYIDQLDHDNRPAGSFGTDYWPVKITARYHPRIVQSRVVNTSQQYARSTIVWLRFATILIFAILSAIWRGPRQLSNFRNRKRIA